MAKVLIAEIRKLRANEEIAFLNLSRRISETDEGSGFEGNSDQDLMSGINVLVREIQRLQRKLRKSQGKR